MKNQVSFHHQHTDLHKLYKPDACVVWCVCTMLLCASFKSIPWSTAGQQIWNNTTVKC